MIKMSKKEYAENGGINCPCCEGDVEGSGVEVEAGMAYQEMNCTECDATWNDVYKLISYEELNENE